MTAIDAIEKALNYQFKDAKHRYLHGADLEPEAYQKILSSQRARVERNRQRQRTNVVQSWAIESTGFESDAVRKDNEWMQRRWHRG